MHNQHNIQILIWVSRCVVFFCVFLVLVVSGFQRFSEWVMTSDQNCSGQLLSGKKGVTTEAIEMDSNQYQKELHHKDHWVLSRASNAMHSSFCFQRRMLLCCCFLGFFPPDKPVWYFSQLCELKCKSEASSNTFIPQMLLLQTKSFHFSNRKYKGKLWN